MAKKKRKERSSVSKATRDAIKDLHAAHKTGQEILRSCTQRAAYGEGQIAEEARRRGSNEQTIRQLRKLAELYPTKAQLDAEICSLMRESDSPVGETTSVSIEGGSGGSNHSRAIDEPRMRSPMRMRPKNAVKAPSQNSRVASIRRAIRAA